MGILRHQDVINWQQAAIEELHDLTRDPDDAGPIGRRAGSPIEHTATWISLDPKSGKLVYGKEEAIEVYRGHEKVLPEQLQFKLGMRDIRGWLFQVRLGGPSPQPGAFARMEGKEILLSKLPQSRNYFVRRKLKACKHEKSAWEQVARAWDKYPEMKLADERLDRVLQDLSATPFVSFKECRAAWAVAPKRFRALGAERFDTQDDYTIAALDIPFQEACDWLRVDPLLQRALDLTESGCLFLEYQSAADVRAAQAAGLRPPQGPVRPPVTEGLCENKDQLMKAACWAALCGRETPDTPDPVAESAVLLYHRFAYNFVDREKDPVVRPPTGSMDLGNLPEGAGTNSGWGIRELTARWRDMGYTAAVPILKQITNRVLSTPEDEIEEEFLSTWERPLAAWPPEWNRPDGLDRALQRLENLGK